MCKSKLKKTIRAEDVMAHKAPSKCVTASQLAEIRTPISYESNKYLWKFLCGRLHTAADHFSSGSHVALSIYQAFKIYLKRDNPLLFSQHRLDLTSAWFWTQSCWKICAKSYADCSETFLLIKKIKIHSLSYGTVCPGGALLPVQALPC